MIAHSLRAIAHGCLGLVLALVVVVALVLNPLRVLRVGLRVAQVVVRMVENIASGRYMGGR